MGASVDQAARGIKRYSLCSQVIPVQAGHRDGCRRVDPESGFFSAAVSTARGTEARRFWSKRGGNRVGQRGDPVRAAGTQVEKNANVCVFFSEPCHAHVILRRLCRVLHMIFQPPLPSGLRRRLVERVLDGDEAAQLLPCLPFLLPYPSKGAAALDSSSWRSSPGKYCADFILRQRDQIRATRFHQAREGGPPGALLPSPHFPTFVSFAP